MSRISRDALVAAVQKVRAMDLAQHEQLADELFQSQPNVLASALAPIRLGVSAPKLDFLIRTVLICFQAMKESGLVWPLISEDEQERQMSRLSGSMTFGDGLPADLRDRAVQQYLAAHPEKDLLAFVNDETAQWLQSVEPEESDKYVVMAALNFVNCIAHVPLPAPRRPAASKRKKKK